MMDDGQRMSHRLHVKQGKRSKRTAYEIQSVTTGRVLETSLLDALSDRPGEFGLVRLQPDP